MYYFLLTSLYYLSPLLTTARYVAIFDFVHTEPLATLLHLILCPLTEAGLLGLHH